MCVWSFKSFIKVVCQNPSWGRITDISHGEWKDGEGGARPLSIHSWEQSLTNLTGIV